jgi:hypothetical protein
MSWFRSDSRKEHTLSSTVDMPPPMARSATSRKSSDAAATNAQTLLDARRAAEEHRAAALERAIRSADTDVEDAVVKAERHDGAAAQHRDDAPAQQHEDVKARQRDDAKALRRDEAQAQPSDDVPTQPSDDLQTQRDGKTPQARKPGDTHAPSLNDDQPLPPLFSAEVAQTFRARWDATQTNFVDDPRKAVLEADELVEQMIKTLAQSFAQERARQMNETASTENMRVALRRYRSLFQRMLSL